MKLRLVAPVFGRLGRLGRLDRLARLALALAALAPAACGGGGGDGTVVLRASGEEAAKTGFPSTRAGTAVAFADGWSVTFSSVLVSLGRVRLADVAGEVAVDDAARFVVDLAKGDPEMVRFGNLEAKRWDRFSFAIEAPQQGDARVGDVAEADLADMVAKGLTHRVRGTAQKNGTTVAIALDLAAPTRNQACTNGTDGTDGIVVRAGASTPAEITMHLEHLFWDSLGTEGAALRFDPWAAVAGADGVVTLEDLQQQSLTNLVGLDGQRLVDEAGRPVTYNPGSFPLRAPTLAELVRLAGSTMAHFNGTGLCQVTAQ